MRIREYRENVDLIEIDGKEIYLIGTAHVSQASANLAEEIIREIRPEAVAVELCQSRYESFNDPDRWKRMDIASVIKSGKAYVLLAQLVIASFQKRIGKQLNVRPGAEMMKAIEVAREVDAKLILADREIRTTLKRVWGSLNLRASYRLLSTALGALFNDDKVSSEEIERLKSSHALEQVLAEFTRAFPEIRAPLITERDQYLAEQLRRSHYKRVVAVVGAGHVPGIREYIQTPQDLEVLSKIPPKSLLSQIASWGIPVVIVALLVAGFFFAEESTTSQMIWSWILITGASAAFGTILALGHPLSILAAFVSAPLTTIHPFLASGMISAFVEAMVRKPTVGDLESVADDFTQFRRWHRNRVIRVLLNLVLTNLFGSLGVFLSGFVLASLLKG